MSDVLRARIRDCLTDYQVVTYLTLDLDELAAEILDAVLPAADADYDTEPIWRDLVANNPGRCMNCLCPVDDCGCCIGCGQVDADIFGSHGSWCAL